jgi:hypothetical protein
MTKIIDFDEKKQRKKDYFRKYYYNNKKAFLWYAKKYRLNHPDIVRRIKQNWYIKNKQKVREKQAMYRQNKKLEKVKRYAIQRYIIPR